MLEKLRKAAQDAETAFETVLRKHYPRADRFTWLHVNDRVTDGRADKFDREMAGNQDINKAWETFISQLHTFYNARDGEKGVLGSRGI